MRHIAAYAFESPLSLPEILVRFQELGPWRWIERDNDRFGEYISARVLPEPDQGMAKVFVEPDHFALNLVLEADAAQVEAVCQAFFIELLPAIGAGALREIDTYE